MKSLRLKTTLNIDIKSRNNTKSLIEIATKKDYNHSAIVQFNIEDFPIKAS